MGKFIMNGVPYGGGTQIYNNTYGAFIDTNRVIVPSTTIPANTDVTYTATEDCAVVWNMALDTNATMTIYINGIRIQSIYSSNSIIDNADYVYLKTGQTITMRMSYTHSTTTHYTVYGLTFGTNNIFTPQLYSTTEREVGTWIDNKPLYQKSYILNAMTIGSDWTSTGITLDLDIDYICRGELVRQDNAGSLYVDTNIVPATRLLRLRRPSTQAVNNGAILTIWYIKSSDVAGSGQYDTLGVPMKHYDGNEKIIGTYFGETLYEKSLEVNLTSNQTNVDISSLNASEIINYFGTITYQSGNDHFTRKVEYDGYPRQNYYNFFQFDISNGIMEIYSNDYEVYNKIRVTLQYTKSTT